MIIDVHAHAMDDDLLNRLVRDASLGFSDALRKEGGAYYWQRYGLIDAPLYDLSARLRSLEQRGIDRQLVGMWPPFLNATRGGASVEFARVANECLDRVCGQAGGRLAGMAVVAFGAPDEMVRELEAAVDRYGFPGVMLGTSVDGEPLDLPQYQPIFAAIERLGLVAFMHPTGGFDRAAYRDYSMRVLVGFPTETTLAVGRLIFSGVLERHPALKLILAHGGGTVAYLRGRLDLGYAAKEYEHNPACRNISQPPSAYLHRLYFDTLVADDDVLRFLLDTFGADHVLFGSDFPFEIGDPVGEHAMRVIQSLPPEAARAVSGGNAARLLNRA